MPQKAAGYSVEIRGDGNSKHRTWIKHAKERLREGKSFRRTWREHTWIKSEDQYEGRHWPGEGDVSSSDLIVVNMSFATVNVIVPYMTGSEPNFLVLPLGQGATEKSAAIQQAMLNRQWRAEIKGQEELESGSVDFLIYGDAWFKVGYDIVERRVGEEGGMPRYTDVAKLWVSRINPWDVWIDPTSDGIHNARWVCHRIRLTKAEVEQSDYANKSRIKYSKSEAHDPDSLSGNRLRETVFDSTEFASIYEFYDLVENYCVVFVDDGDFPLAVTEEIPAVPIVQMGNYRIPNSPYHMGELEQLWSIQYELNKTRSQMIQHRARNSQKYVVRKGTLSPQAKKALESDVVNAVVEIDAGDAQVHDVLVPLAVTNLSGDVYNMSEVLQADIYEVSGVNEYLRGATPAIRRTATEATIIEGATNARTSFKLRQIEKAARSIGTLLLGFAADIYPMTDYDEMQLYLTGRDAQLVARSLPPEEQVDEMGEPIDPMSVSQAVVTPSPDIFIGTYEVLVEQSSTELRSPAMREEKYRGLVMDLLGALPILGQMGVQLDIRKLLVLWFEAAGIDDVEGLFVGGLPPELGGTGQSMDMTGAAPGQDPLAMLQELATGMSPDEVPPELVMGQFDDENTGMLPTI